jgi:DNA polymerase-1
MKYRAKVGEYLREGIEQLKLSQQLTTIKKDVALDFGIEDLAVNDINQDKLHKLFSEFEFKTLLKNTEAKKTPVTKENYRCVLTEKELNDLVKELKTAEFLAFDTETDSLDFTQANLVGLSLAANEEKSYYIPVGHDYDGAPKQLDLEVVLKKLKPIIESTPLIGQHLKFDRNVLSNYDITINEIENDTMLMSYVFDPTATRHNLDAMAGHYLNVKTTTFEDVAGKGVKQLTFNQIPLEKASDYAAEDADITFRCYAHLKPKLAKTPSLEKVLSEIEIPLVPVLSDMEQAGAIVDKDSLKIQSNNLGQRISGLEEQAYREAGKEFNLASTKDLRAIFFDEMELPVVKKTPGGQPSTDESVLQELANQYELPKILLEHRTLAKLKSTYTDSLPQQISPKLAECILLFTKR